MNILNIEHVTKSYGSKMVLDDVSCGIQEGEKVGIIGINGTGKTTLLRMIAGLETPDEGKIIRQTGIRLAVLEQNQEFPEDAAVLPYVTGAGQSEWIRENEAKSMLNHLGMSAWDVPVCQLSGGQKKRVALAKTLLEPSDILILDEPTNHLDEEMMGWLEEYLKKYRGTVIMVTHDRYFLDRTTSRILEIDHTKVYSYDADYSGFLEKKAQRQEMELASERKRQSILRMELEWAKRGCRARSTKQKARLERLENLKQMAGPEKETLLEMDCQETRLGKKTVELHHVSKSCGGRILVDDFDYIFLKNQKVGMIGPNGCGKTTLLKMIAGILKPDAGNVTIGETVRMSYFAQEIPDMDGNQRVIDYVREIAEYIPTRDGKITASQMLERFLFTPEMQYAPIHKLSGGEKRRLYLLGTLQTAPNVLIMDEVSNEIDIPTLTILEDYLNSFSGIVVMVSHDRYFLDNVADRIFAFEGEGKLKQYEGGYSDYLEAKQRNVAEDRPEQKKEKKRTGNSIQNRRQKREEKLRFTYKEQREFETIEDAIAALEQQAAILEDKMMAYATDPVKLGELMEQKEQSEAALEEKMERWVYLNDLAERIADGKEG